MDSNRWNKMDEFLKVLAALSEVSPNYLFDKRAHVFYSELVRIGVSNEQRDFFVGNYFGNWIQDFQNKKDIDVFVDENWSYFCQFTNGNLHNERTHIKMYIPFRPDTIYEGANIIFNFLAENNIKHSSKIGKEARVDGVVIRVASKEDALKIARFVENTPFIKTGIFEPNPFLLSDGNIAYATDANYSFNDELSRYLEEYISNRYYTGNLQNVNIRDFFLYVQDSYNQVFYKKNEDAIRDYAAKRGIKQDSKYYSNLANKSEIVKLLLYSMSAENDLNRVMEVYDNLMNEEYMRNLEASFKPKQNTPSIPTEHMTETQTLHSNLRSNELINAIYANYSKYGYGHAVEALKKFVDTGDVMSFTRTSNARTIIESMTQQEVKNIIVSECGSLNYDLFMNEMLKKQALQIKAQHLETACIGTLRKYKSVAQIRTALSEAKRGNFSYFSNCGDLNLREKLIRNVEPEEIEMLMKTILIKYGVDNENDLTEEFLSHLQIMAGMKSNNPESLGQR